MHLDAQVPSTIKMENQLPNTAGATSIKSLFGAADAANLKKTGISSIGTRRAGDVGSRTHVVIGLVLVC